MQRMVTGVQGVTATRGTKDLPFLGATPPVLFRAVCLVRAIANESWKLEAGQSVAVDGKTEVFNVRKRMMNEMRMCRRERKPCQLIDEAP
jgi:hypothetical protein